MAWTRLVWVLEGASHPSDVLMLSMGAILNVRSSVAKLNCVTAISN
jgi:hypothetical protein